MSSPHRPEGGSSASWRKETTIGVDYLFRGIYSLGEQAIGNKGNFNIASHQPNLTANPLHEAGGTDSK